MALHCNGETLPSKSLRPRFDTSHSGHIPVMAYQTLFKGTDNLHKDQGIRIDREDFAAGYTLFTVDLSPDASDEAHLNLVGLRNGSVCRELQFQTALPNTANLIVYGEQDSILEVTKSRYGVLDFEI